MIIRRTKRRNCGKLQTTRDAPLSPYALVYEAIVPKDYGVVEDRGKRVGCIRVDDTGEGVTPFWSWVERPYRRLGVGTKLYEAAARGSCHVFKQPLKSALKLSRQSRGFWEKQYKKGPRRLRDALRQVLRGVLAALSAAGVSRGRPRDRAGDPG